jgi:hypothetical protein
MVAYRESTNGMVENGTFPEMNTGEIMSNHPTYVEESIILRHLI